MTFIAVIDVSRGEVKMTGTKFDFFMLKNDVRFTFCYIMYSDKWAIDMFKIPVRIMLRITDT